MAKPKPDAELMARAAGAREVIRDYPDVDRLWILSQVVWPGPALEAYYTGPVASSSEASARV